MAAQCTLIIKLKDAGIGEKPKVFLDNKEVGKVSVSKELSLTVSVGKHRVRLHGLAGGGRTAEIDIQASETVKSCVFSIDMLSLRERYYLADTYSESAGYGSYSAPPEVSGALQAEGALYPAERKSKKGLAVFFVIVIAVIVLVCVNLSNANKLEGTYYGSNGLYYIFDKNGNVEITFVGGTEMRLGGTGTYELNGDKLTIYIKYNGLSTTETNIWTYNKSTDTITGNAGVVYKRQK